MRNSKIGEAGGGSGISRGGSSIFSTPSGRRLPTNTPVKVSNNVSVKPKGNQSISVKESDRLRGINAPKTSSTKGNARGLKAANKPASKGNAGQTASKFKKDVIKNAAPARANRTRLGKSALKSK